MRRTRIIAAVSAAAITSSVILGAGVSHAVVTEEPTPTTSASTSSSNENSSDKKLTMKDFEGVDKVAAIGTVDEKNKQWASAAQVLLTKKGGKPITLAKDNKKTLLENVTAVEKMSPDVWIIKPDPAQMKEPSVITEILDVIGEETPVIWVNDDTTKTLTDKNKEFGEKATELVTEAPNGVAVNTSDLTPEALKKKFSLKDIKTANSPEAVLAGMLSSVEKEKSTSSSSTVTPTSGATKTANESPTETPASDLKAEGVDPVKGDLPKATATGSPKDLSEPKEDKPAEGTTEADNTEVPKADSSAEPTPADSSTTTKASEPAAASGDLAGIQKAVEPLTTASGMKVGFAAGDGKTVVKAGDNAPVYSASTIKIPIAMAVLKNLKTTDQVQVTEVVGGAGGKITAGSHTVDALLTEMIENSDNTATNALIDKLGGYEKVNAITTQLGATDFKLSNKMMSGETTSTITAESAVKVLNDILNSSNGEKGYLSKEQAEVIINHMKKQRHRTKLPAGIPAEAVANKTGENTGVSHDIGFITNNGKTVAVAATTAGASADSAGPAQIGKIGKAVYDNTK